MTDVPTDSSPDNDIAAVAIGTSINTTAGIINAGLSFIFTLLVGRELGADQAGALFLAIAVFSIVGLISELGAVASIVRSISRYRALLQIRKLRITIAIATVPTTMLAFAVGTVLFVFAPEWSSILVRHGDRSAVQEYLRIFAIVLPAATLGDILLGATRGFGTMLPSAAIDQVIKPAVRVSLLFAILQVTHSTFTVGIAWAIPIVLALVLATIALRGLLRTTAGSSSLDATSADTRVLARSFWHFALPQSLSSILQVAVVWIDVILLSALKSTGDAGTYATLSRYLLVGTLGLSALALAVAPLMSGLLAEGAVARAGMVYKTTTAWIVSMAFPIYFVMAVFAPVLMRLFGKSFSGGAEPLTILSIAMLANIATGPVLMILLMGGRSGLLFINSGIAFIINVSLNVALIPPFGMNGAAIAWSSGILAMNGLALLQVWRAWHIHPYSRGVWFTGVWAAMLYGALGVVLAHLLGMGMTAFLATCLLGSMLYAAVLWRMRRELKLASLVGLVKRRRMTARFEAA